jgi:hypothetical protein
MGWQWTVLAMYKKRRTASWYDTYRTQHQERRGTKSRSRRLWGRSCFVGQKGGVRMDGTASVSRAEQGMNESEIPSPIAVSVVDARMIRPDGAIMLGMQADDRPCVTGVIHESEEESILGGHFKQC